MIPKIIHFVWFGGNPYSKLTLKCIESWKKYCPDYEIHEWNENNFNVDVCAYVKEAYEAKKWAFVSDYVRLYALVKEGGIYMDTDVEVLSSLDPFLKHQAFSGFENAEYVPTGIMGCEKGNPVFKELLDEYNNRHFIRLDGSMDLTTNVVTITNFFMKHGLSQNNSYQEINGFAIYPKNFFCPIEQETGELVLTEDTVTIHHFNGSWVDKDTKHLQRLRQHLMRNYNNKKIRTVLFYSMGFPWMIKLRLLKLLKKKKFSKMRKQ